MAAKDWIAKATSTNKGSFSAAAKRAGKSTAEYAAEKDDASGATGKRARLAEMLMKLRKK
jgi:hypothetical protein